MPCSAVRLEWAAVRGSTSQALRCGVCRHTGEELPDCRQLVWQFLLERNFKHTRREIPRSQTVYPGINIRGDPAYVCTGIPSRDGPGQSNQRYAGIPSHGLQLRTGLSGGHQHQDDSIDDETGTTPGGTLRGYTYCILRGAISQQYVHVTDGRTVATTLHWTSCCCKRSECLVPSSKQSVTRLRGSCAPQRSVPYCRSDSGAQRAANDCVRPSGNEHEELCSRENRTLTTTTAPLGVSIGTHPLHSFAHLGSWWHYHCFCVRP